MTRLRWFTTVCLCSLGVFSISALAADPGSTNWPQFRGPNASGVADGNALPTDWNGETGRGIKWKTPIPGLAHSSPLVWGDRAYVTTAVSADANPYLRVGLYGESPDHPEQVEHDFRLLALDKSTGKIVWDQSCRRAIPKVKRHIKATHANSTPATDGKHVVAFFGAEGLYGFDVDGRQLWSKDLGVFDAGPADAKELQWGFASSPVIHGGKVFIQCDARNVSFIAAFDVHDGKELWRTPRPLYPGWGSPTVHVDKDRAQVIANGYLHIGGYDLNDGRELWKMHGGGDVPVPTPIVAHDLIYLTSAHGGDAPVWAVKTSASGDITLPADATTNEHVTWSHPKIGNYMQTPLVYGYLLYCCRDSGILACYDARTGEKHYRERLAGGVGFTASPVAGDGKVYFTSEEGEVYVVKAGPSFELLRKNPLGEICMATPAISGGVLYFRAKDHLFAVGH